MNWFKSFWKRWRKSKPPPAEEEKHSAEPKATFMSNAWAELAKLKSARTKAQRFYKEHFTPRATQVLVLARQEAVRLNHNFVGTEHVLLGLMRLGEGVAFDVLKKFGLDLETVRMEVEKQVGTGPDTKVVGNIPYTPRVKKVLAFATNEAKARNLTFVGTEHILLGLLREGDGIAARVLGTLHILMEETRREILKETNSNLPPCDGGPQKVDRFQLSWKNPVETAVESGGIPAGLLGHFTPRATQVLALAQKEADRLRHHFIGTDHVLLGLIGLRQGIAFNVLKRHGLELENARRAVEKEAGIGPDEKMAGIVPYAPRVKKVLALAEEEAESLNHAYVGTEHILLGLLREGEGPAARVLKTFNVDFEQTRKEILRELTPNSPSAGNARKEPGP
jgi:ATP-dependent Clp protease ATP-binding subunit ClpA